MASKKEQKQKTPTERMYKIIHAPHVTEKSTLGSEHGQVTLRVAMDASKPEIKKAVETLWDVKVKGVNTVVQKGKRKSFRGVQGKQKDFKKAVISLEEGHMIDVGLGV
jgi:large subunit ribosomal protein L23